MINIHLACKVSVTQFLVWKWGHFEEEWYLPSLWYGSVPWEISALFPDMQQRYISGYWKVLSRIWNGADRLFCLCKVNYCTTSTCSFSSLYSALVQNLFARLGEFTLWGVSLEMLAAQRLSFVTEWVLVLGTVASVGYPGTGGVN